MSGMQAVRLQKEASRITVMCEGGTVSTRRIDTHHEMNEPKEAPVKSGGVVNTRT
jgi:hypothetical protein